MMPTVSLFTFLFFSEKIQKENVLFSFNFSDNSCSHCHNHSSKCEKIDWTQFADSELKDKNLDWFSACETRQSSSEYGEKIKFLEN